MTTAEGGVGPAW